jgi:hypothetical protein
VKRAKGWPVTPADECRVGVCIYHKNGKRVAASRVAAFITCAYKREFKKNPVTLRDNTNTNVGCYDRTSLMPRGVRGSSARGVKTRDKFNLIRTIDNVPIGLKHR